MTEDFLAQAFDPERVDAAVDRLVAADATYMEDTFATARSFREGGTWTIRADPDAAEPLQV